MTDHCGTRKLFLAGFFASCWLCGLCVQANAQVTTVFITVDENCNGTINGFAGLQPLACSFSLDPGPGGLSGVMNYNLAKPPAFALELGDVVLRETGTGNSDVIRFSSVGGGSLFFYSDLDGGVDALADIGLPTTLNTSVLFFNEVSLGPLGSGLIYTPSIDQPGSVSRIQKIPVQYTFISDAQVPEPSSFFLLAIGGAFAALISLRRRKRMIADNQTLTLL